MSDKLSNLFVFFWRTPMSLKKFFLLCNPYVEEIHCSHSFFKKLSTASWHSQTGRINGHLALIPNLMCHIVSEMSCSGDPNAQHTTGLFVLQSLPINQDLQVRAKAVVMICMKDPLWTIKSILDKPRLLYTSVSSQEERHDQSR